MSVDDCCSNTCSFSSSQNVHDDSSAPIKKTIHILDNDLCLRSIPNSSKSNIIPNNTGRFDELTNFFNMTNCLFRQSAFIVGVNTDHLARLLRLPEMNVGLNMHINQRSLEEHKIDLLKNITFYSLIGRNGVDTAMHSSQQQNRPTSSIKFHTADKNLMLSVNHRWTPSLTTTFRLGTRPQTRLWSHVEYRSSTGIYELIGEYSRQQQHSPSIQFSCLSCLWQRMNCQIDGGLDLKITSKQKLADICLRLRRSSTSIVFKCDLHHPFENYLIGIQHCINANFTVGLLAEKVTDYHQEQPIKFSLMSQRHFNTIGLRLNILVNTQHELGIALTHRIRQCPLILQTFGLYSWTTRRCKWGIGLQLLL